MNNTFIIVNPKRENMDNIPEGTEYLLIRFIDISKTEEIYYSNLPTSLKGIYIAEVCCPVVPYGCDESNRYNGTVQMQDLDRIDGYCMRKIHRIFKLPFGCEIKFLGNRIRFDDLVFCIQDDFSITNTLYDRQDNKHFSRMKIMHRFVDFDNGRIYKGIN